MFVVFLPVLLLFVTFVIDVGNWFEHKRHLQLQADAAALAGGGKFSFPCSDSAIEAEARNYAGASASTPGAQWNTQIGGTQSGNVHALLNSTDFWNDGGNDHSAGGGPCGVGYLDVKMTESNLPWLLQVAQVPAINAHARVSFNQIDTQSGALPVGVPGRESEERPGRPDRRGRVPQRCEPLELLRPRDGAARQVGRVPAAQRSAPVLGHLRRADHAGEQPRLHGEAQPRRRRRPERRRDAAGELPRGLHEDPRHLLRDALRQSGRAAAVDEGPPGRPGLHRADRPGGRPGAEGRQRLTLQHVGDVSRPVLRLHRSVVHRSTSARRSPSTAPRTRSGRRCGQTSTARTIRSPARRLRPRRAPGRRPERFRWHRRAGAETSS